MLASLLRASAHALNCIKKAPGTGALSIFAISICAAAIVVVGSLSKAAKDNALAFTAREGHASVLIRLEPSYDEVLSNTSPKFNVEDRESLLAAIPHAQRVIPVLTVGARTRPVWSGDVEHHVQVFGTDPVWVQQTKNEMSLGRFLSAADVITKQDVCVVGHAFLAYGKSQPQSIRVGTYTCRVVGVLASRGAFFGVDFDKIVILPIGVAESLARSEPNSDIEFIVTSTQGTISEAFLSGVRSRVRLLLNRSPGQSDGFLLIDAKGLSKYLDEVVGSLYAVLTLLLSITMAVAGLGILSLMISSVVTRTAEIGIRRALGANQRDIALQFLMEAVLISAAGGFLGAILAGAGVISLNHLAIMPGQLSLDLYSMLLATTISAAIGVIFGLWPGLRAAKLEPTRALAYE